MKIVTPYSPGFGLLAGPLWDNETENLLRFGLNLSKIYVKIAIGHKLPYWCITFILKEINPQKNYFWLAQMFV